MSEEKDYLTVLEAARLVGCTRQHIYEQVWRRRIPYEEKEKVTKQIMIKKEDVDKINFGGRK